MNPYANTQRTSDNTQTFGLDDDASVEDFMTRFSDPHTYVAPDEARQHFERFQQAGHPDLNDAASSYLSQVDPSQFAQAAHNMDSGQRAGLAGGLMNALRSAGIDLGPIGQMLGLSSTDPQRMQPDDIGRLAEYAQRNAPSALQQTAREQPFLMRALGNPLVQGALAIMAARYLSNRRR